MPRCSTSAMRSARSATSVQHLFAKALCHQPSPAQNLFAVAPAPCAVSAAVYKSANPECAERFRVRNFSGRPGGNGKAAAVNPQTADWRSSRVPLVLGSTSATQSDERRSGPEEKRLPCAASAAYKLWNRREAPDPRHCATAFCSEGPCQAHRLPDRLKQGPLTLLARQALPHRPFGKWGMPYQSGKSGGAHIATYTCTCY